MSFYKGKRSTSAPKKVNAVSEADWRGRAVSTTKELETVSNARQPPIPYTISEMNVLIEPVLSNGSVVITETLIYHHNTVFSKHSRRITHDNDVKLVSIECQQDPTAKLVHKKIFGKKDFAFSWEFAPTSYQRIFKIKYILERGLTHDAETCLDILQMNNMKLSIQAPIRDFHVTVVLPSRLFVFQKHVILNHSIPKDMLMDGMHVAPSTRGSRTGQTKLRKLEFGVQNADKYESITLDLKWIDSNALKGLDKQSATEAINALRVRSGIQRINTADRSSDNIKGLPEPVYPDGVELGIHDLEADNYDENNLYDDEQPHQQYTVPTVNSRPISERTQSPQIPPRPELKVESEQSRRASAGSSHKEIPGRPMSASRHRLVPKLPLK